MKLTIESAKGCEFTDVIVYNVLNPKYQDKWNVLKYLEIFKQRGVKNFSLKDVNIS